MRGSRIIVVACLLTLAACGSTDDDPSAEAVPSATTDPATPVATPAPTDLAPTTTMAPASGGSTPAPTSAPAPAGSAPAATATTAPATATTQVPPVAAPLPDDGCSADNSPTSTDVADGPVPSLEVRAESVSNQLPDLAVRRINCAGGWVNLKNEIPAATPLLIWFWAPH